MKNKIIAITYCNPDNSTPWIAFNRVYTTGYYNLGTYEREELAQNIFNKYFKSSPGEFSFHGMKTIITIGL